MDIKRKKCVRLLFLLLCITLSSLFIQMGNNFLSNYSENSFNNIYDVEKLHTSNGNPKTIQLLQNPNFNLPIDPWYSDKSGDISHVNATASSGNANFELIGEQRTFSYVANPPNNSDFTESQNSGYLFPDNTGIDSRGCYVSHMWNETEGTPDQIVSVHWCKNITMPVNMSEHEISSASLFTMINATVHANNGPLGGIEIPGDSMEFGMSYDYAQFYVIISNFDKTKNYNVIDHRISDLGNDSAGTYDILPDTYLTTEPEANLTRVLSQALESNDYNFIITLGIDIYCEDNFGVVNETDIWDELRFKFFNLTFTYDNKITYPTILSWNQNINNSFESIIDDYYPIITNATINLKYRINQTWPTSLLSNSRIEILINNNQHSESIGLRNMTVNFQEVIFNITSLIPYNERINVSVQLRIFDELVLNKSYRISIDDMYLNVSYIPSLKPIFIDGAATGVDAHNWSWAVNQDWCVYKDGRYYLENLTINGYGASCIEIRNSNVNLVINNCTLYNATDNQKTGITLINVNNTRISNNNISLTTWGIYIHSNNVQIVNNSIANAYGDIGTNGSDGSVGADGDNGGNGGTCYGIYNNANFSSIIDNLIYNLNGGNGGKGGNGGSSTGSTGGNGGFGGSGGVCYGIYSIGHHNVMKYNNLSNIIGGIGGNGGDGGSGLLIGGNGGNGLFGGDCYGIYSNGLNCSITCNQFLSINSGKGGNGGNRGIGITLGNYGYGMGGGYCYGINSNGVDCKIRNNRLNNVEGGNGGSIGGTVLPFTFGGDGVGGYTYGVESTGNDCIIEDNILMNIISGNGCIGGMAAGIFCLGTNSIIKGNELKNIICGLSGISDILDPFFNLNVILSYGIYCNGKNSTIKNNSIIQVRGPNRTNILFSDIIYSSSACGIYNNQNNCTINNNTIYNIFGGEGNEINNSPGGFGGIGYGIKNSGSNNSIENNRIVNIKGGEGGNATSGYNGGDGGEGYGIYNSGNIVKIKQNILHNLTGGNGGNGSTNSKMGCGYGLYLIDSNYNKIEEVNSSNNEYGIYLTNSNNSIIFNNTFIGNKFNARDYGNGNNWNNSVIGNYWDDYLGIDADFNGIGDIMHNISQSPLVQDFLPIWDSTIDIISPSQGINFTSRTPPNFNVIFNDPNVNITWYSINGGDNITFTSNGPIDQGIWEGIWDSLNYGDTITVTFYFNNTMGYEAFKDVSGTKVRSSDETGGIEGPSVPGFDLLIFSICIIGIISLTIWFRKKQIKL